MNKFILVTCLCLTFFSATKSNAYPNVGDKSVYVVKDYKNGQWVQSGIIAHELVSYDPAKDTFISRVTVTTPKKSWVENWEVQSGDYNQKVRKNNVESCCSFRDTAVRETITVPAGNFEVCTETHTFYNSRQSVGDVPFGLVKREEFYDASQSLPSSTIELISVTLGPEMNK